MANNNKNIFSANDALDINELASLNDDISNEFIEQLQNQLTQSANLTNDGAMFEEVNITEEKTDNVNVEPEKTKKVEFDSNLDDNFIKKYKARLNKQNLGPDIKTEEVSNPTQQEVQAEQTQETSQKPTEEIKIGQEVQKEEKTTKNKKVSSKNNEAKNIENLTSGNIIEKQTIPEEVDYIDSLDYLDDNIKYSKYVIYIEPENVEFISSLTVKERKNLVNRILKEQDSLTTTRNKLALIQTFIKHAIIAIITITISIPLMYYLINISLEATINNYQRSKTNFKVLYKEKGKIQKNIRH